MTTVGIFAKQTIILQVWPSRVWEKMFSAISSYTRGSQPKSISRRSAEFLDGLEFLLARVSLAWKCLHSPQINPPTPPIIPNPYLGWKRENDSQWAFKSIRKIPQGPQPLCMGQGVSSHISWSLIPGPCAQQSSQAGGQKTLHILLQRKAGEPV
jgi:hypothetical protein